jgi:hypothetical protein
MKHRIVLLITLVSFLATLTACSAFIATPIERIKSNPREYTDKRVKISGTVTETFSLLVLRYFILNDGTGEMYVVTKKSMPANGEKVKVSGTVRDAFSLGDIQLLVLLEDGEDAKYRLMMNYLLSD